MAAARSLLASDGAEPYAPVPYFWSDQYSTKIQFVGHVESGDEVHVVDGSIEERKFVVVYGRAGRLVCALGFSRTKLVLDFRRVYAAYGALAYTLQYATRSA